MSLISDLEAGSERALNVASSHLSLITFPFVAKSIREPREVSRMKRLSNRSSVSAFLIPAVRGQKVFHRQILVDPFPVHSLASADEGPLVSLFCSCRMKTRKTCKRNSYLLRIAEIHNMWSSSKLTLWMRSSVITNFLPERFIPRRN
jgi:hypothetical protein